MKSPHPLALIFAGSLLFSASALRAQQALYVDDGQGRWSAVRDAIENTPVVFRDGKYVPQQSNRFMFRAVDEYAPVLVSVKIVKSENDDFDGNDEFDFRARFMSPYRLRHVFVVLEMNTNDAGKALFLQQVGDLIPHQPKVVAVQVPLTRHLGLEHLKEIHIFTDGREVLRSDMSKAVRDAALDKLVRGRIAGVADERPRFFVGPMPEYPAQLAKTKETGHVVVRLRIAADGKIDNPIVLSASDPAFGAAALDAVRMWRFLPMIR
ncbi:MAG: energy transducer TonB, partial [Opitutaceae bacterium]